jgi:type I restriction enzyme S subunit
VSIEPLFSIPLHWQVTTLGEACKRGGGNIQTGPFGSQLHASDYVAFGIPSIMPQNIGDNRVITTDIARITREDAERLSRYRVQPGDIVYSRRGDVERRGLIHDSENGWLCGTGCLRIRVGNGPLDPVFTSFYLGHPEVKNWIVRHAIGATMPNLNTSILSALPMIVPPVKEQHEIAELLGTLDDKIEINRRMNETLEAITCATVAAMFPWRELHSNEIRFCEIAEISHDGLNPGEYQKETFEHYSIPAFDEQRLPVRAMGDQIKSNKFIVHDDSILLSKLNPRIPRVWLPVVTRNMRSICSTEFLVLHPRPGYSREFIYGLCSSATFQEIFATMVTGTSGSHQRVKPEYLQKMAIASPDLKKVERFTKLVRPLYARVVHNLQENSTLAVVRDTLLPKLISGEIRIKQAEKLIEANA